VTGDGRQTDHATEKCVAIGGIAYAKAILPKSNKNKNKNKIHMELH